MNNCCLGKWCQPELSRIGHLVDPCYIKPGLQRSIPGLKCFYNYLKKIQFLEIPYKLVRLRYYGKTV